MRRSLAIVLLTTMGLLPLDGRAGSSVTCPPDKGVALQVLGSGGPVADDARSSAGYLIWIDGRSRVLIDVGGGVFLRFGEAGASFEDLEFIGMSHFHTDHSADLPSLLKSGYFSGRSRPLAVAGPAGAGPFPGLEAFLNGLLSPDRGAYRYLAGYLDGSDGLPELRRVEVAIDPAVSRPAFSARADPLAIDARPVPHGIVPALAYRVRVGDLVLVFAGDQNGSDQGFVDFAAGADLLIMHMAIPESAGGAAVRLHARPSQIGAIAADVGVGRLLLSHLMARSLRDLDANVAEVRKGFEGELLVANDLDCLRLSRAIPQGGAP